MAGNTIIFIAGSGFSIFNSNNLVLIGGIKSKVTGNFKFYKVITELL